LLCDYSLESRDNDFVIVPQLGLGHFNKQYYFFFALAFDFAIFLAGFFAFAIFFVLSNTDD